MCNVFRIGIGIFYGLGNGSWLFWNISIFEDIFRRKGNYDIYELNGDFIIIIFKNKFWVFLDGYFYLLVKGIYF